jgi:hypothetical protein
MSRADTRAKAYRDQPHPEIPLQCPVSIRFKAGRIFLPTSPPSPLQVTEPGLETFNLKSVWIEIIELLKRGGKNLNLFGFS